MDLGRSTGSAWNRCLWRTFFRISFELDLGKVEISVKKHFSENACPRSLSLPAEAVPQNFFRFERKMSGSIGRKADIFIKLLCRHIAAEWRGKHE